MKILIEINLDDEEYVPTDLEQLNYDLCRGIEKFSGYLADFIHIIPEETAELVEEVLRATDSGNITTTYCAKYY